MAQVLGRAYIYANGKLLRTKEGAKLNNFSGKERAPVVGNEVYGYAEKAVAPSIECTVVLTPDTSIQELANLTDATVTFEGDNGKTFVLYEAWQESPINITAGEGEVECKFTGVRCEEQS